MLSNSEIVSHKPQLTSVFLPPGSMTLFGEATVNFITTVMINHFPFCKMGIITRSTSERGLEGTRQPHKVGLGTKHSQPFSSRGRSVFFHSARNVEGQELRPSAGGRDSRGSS